ncbi:MAG TPA: hypothetical protein VHZ09_01950 [Acidobacteriaceae bacterium]|jgi:hypothetical protein|nr:hypothetical protein [Acidobacteriaceae bacterium]
MKIRMNGNSLRLRVGRSELAQFLKEGRLEETIRFAATPEARFTWALEAGSPDDAATTVRYASCAVAIVVTAEQLRLWRREDQVGIYTQVDIGAGQTLDIVVEKDFACLDKNGAENADTFANPHPAAN